MIFHNVCCVRMEWYIMHETAVALINVCRMTAAMVYPKILLIFSDISHKWK